MRTGHTVVRESRTRFCAICGTMAKLKPDEALPPLQAPKPVPYAAVVTDNDLLKIKTEGTHIMAKLTTEQKAEIIRRHEAGENDATLAKAFGCSASTVWYNHSGAGAGKAKKEKKVKTSKPSTKTRRQAEHQDAPPSSFKAGLKAMVESIIEEKLAALDLDAKIGAALARLLK